MGLANVKFGAGANLLNNFMSENKNQLWRRLNSYRPTIHPDLNVFPGVPSRLEKCVVFSNSYAVDV